MAFSEYLLYEPILRVLVHRKYKVACEAKCDYIEGRITEYKEIDFVAKKGAVHFALEVKWHRSKIMTRKLNVTRDHKSLLNSQAISKGDGHFYVSLAHGSTFMP